ncbi:hypothetical protein ID852_13495 [Xenorhabdus sp. 42]|uniref:Orn/Lys/Arg decarboxylase N-terminal domain-containing protein n=1 Tax=Xenorhabdus szentirmaii TaxID=290112 RepID=A0AAW3YVQ7_9GAMM|nr:hypothetical protein [Xenorhabdus sp. CUL]MBD2801124.1 hypothetical protein [Xenorhabdus sp. M]MBD2805518.1 hypothetical protein [Xenorhabdus sp. ZM]MBD2821692.1 hypothetical protein [Xenorhabdus sp. 42]
MQQQHLPFFNSERTIVDIKETHFTDVSAVVISLEDILNGKLERIEETQFSLPVYLIMPENKALPKHILSRVTAVFQSENQEQLLFIWKPPVTHLDSLAELMPDASKKIIYAI